MLVTSHNRFSLVAYLQVCLQEQGNAYGKHSSSCEWFKDVLINSVEAQTILTPPNN